MDVEEFETNEYEWDNNNAPNTGRAETSVLYLLTKRVMDVVLSALALTVFSPFLLLIALTIKLTSKGPVVFKQCRVGVSGKLFVFYKFRSMVNGADNLHDYLTPDLLKIYKTNRKIIGDPRVTRFGGFLRRTSLDELPQLVNVLKGEMSLVGPRPLLPEEIKMYGSTFEKYISVRPGLTGLWQLKGRDMTVMTERARFDDEYIQKKNFTYDLNIIIQTFGSVLLGRGAC